MKRILLVSLFTTLFLAACGSGGGAEKRSTEPVVQYKETVLSCTDGWSQYKVPETSIQFCYLPAWGEPVVEAQEATKGTLNKLSFLNTSTSPVLWYLSTDYEGDGSRPVDFCFSCLRVTSGNEDLQKQMEEELGASDFTARKTDVGAARAVRVSGDELKFYVPNAFEGHHVLISSPKSLAEDLDNFTFDMLF